MAWSTEFLQQLGARSRAPVYYVEALSEDASVGWDFGRVWTASTHPQVYGTQDAIAEDGVRIRGSRLHTQTWTSSLGAFTVSLTDWGAALNRLKRGYVLVLRMGFAGWSLDQMQIVAFGPVRSFAVSRGVATVQVDDPSQLFVSRRSRRAEALQYFGDVKGRTQVSSDWTPGDRKLFVDNVGLFQKPSTTPGIVRCTPSSGDPFLLTYTHIGSKALLNVTTDSSVLDTDPVDLAAGDIITDAAYLRGSPHAILARLLESTGDGSNGSYDHLPKEWGLGLPSSYVAEGDIGVWEGRYKDRLASGALRVDIVVEEAQASGIAWIAQTFAPIGVFLSMRQGQLTVRNALPVNDLADNVTMEITDEDIASVEGHAIWDDSTTHVVSDLEILTGGTSVSLPTFALDDGRELVVRATSTRGTVGDLPGLQAEQVDVSGVSFVNRANFAALVADILGSWRHQIPETISLRTRGWRAGRLAVGDIVALTTTQARGRQESGSGGFSQRPAVVTSVDLFSGAGSTLTLSIPGD